MAIGIAKMFNITFPFNFNSPYKADSIIDFWSRWHMSLTRYLNLYLYNPLAARATRKLAARGLPITRRALAKPLPFTKTIVGPIFFTMVLAGIWHGAGLQFLIFGLLHGIYLVCNHTWRTYGPKATATASGGPNSIVTHLFFVALTYVAVLVGQVFFRSASTHDAFALLRAMVGVNGVGANLPVPYWLVARIGTVGLWLRLHGAVSIVGPLQNGAQAIETIAEMAVAYAIIWCLPNSQTIVGLTEPLKRVTTKPATSLATRRLKMELNVRWGLGMGVLTAIALLEIGAKSEFLYFQF
jgi:hypothetical protein